MQLWPRQQRRASRQTDGPTQYRATFFAVCCCRCYLFVFYSTSFKVVTRNSHSLQKWSQHARRWISESWTESALTLLSAVSQSCVFINLHVYVFFIFMYSRQPAENRVALSAWEVDYSAGASDAACCLPSTSQARAVTPSWLLHKKSHLHLNIIYFFHISRLFIVTKLIVNLM